MNEFGDLVWNQIISRFHCKSFFLTFFIFQEAKEFGQKFNRLNVPSLKVSNKIRTNSNIKSSFAPSAIGKIYSLK